jgi:hypothetical protein
MTRSYKNNHPILISNQLGGNVNLASMLKDLSNGWLNNRGEVMLVSGVNTMTFPTLHTEAHLSLSPLDASAAASNWFYSARQNGRCEITITNGDGGLFSYAVIA